LPKWSQLKVLPRVKVISSMYIWLFIVPLVAKAISSVSGIADLQLFGHKFSVNLSLPFTWQIFYWSALLFSLGNIVFHLRCPRIVKEHENAFEFIEAGKGESQLVSYKEEVHYPSEKFDKEEREASGSMQDLNRRYRSRFWFIYDYANDDRKLWRIACAGLYTLGLLLITYVFVENLLTVISLMGVGKP
jgi:hypothetical protein